MIHDAIVPVTCDNENCTAIVMIEPLRFPVTSRDLFDAFLKGQEWIIINGKHYCSQECADEAEDGKG